MAQPNVEADKLFFSADQLIANGNVAEATDMLLTLINKFPEYGRAYNHLGFVYETKYKDVASAEKYYKSALTYVPDYPPTYLNYAVILSSQERFPELMAILNKAMEVPGVDKGKVYNEFGIMHELQGKYDEAMGYFKKAIVYALNDKDIEMYEKSIKRCVLKQSYK